MTARPEGWGAGKCYQAHAGGDYSAYANCAGQFGAEYDLGGSLVWHCPCPCHAHVAQEVR
jgi:hypothetical protein